MRSELKAMELRKGREVETARAEAIATAATFRGDVQQRLAKQTARAEEAEKERDEARAEIARLVEELEETRAKCAEAVEERRVLKEAALKESSWAQDPAMESMMRCPWDPCRRIFPGRMPLSWTGRADCRRRRRTPRAARRRGRRRRRRSSCLLYTSDAADE